MNKNTSEKPESEEIDFSQIGNRITDSFSAFKATAFRAILFVKRKIIILTVLLFSGFGLGLFLDKTLTSYRHEIIVTPNFGSNDYLYSKIEQFNSKIIQKDTLSLTKSGFKDLHQTGKLTIEPIIDIYKFIKDNEQNFELIKLMAEDGDLEKIVTDKITSKNYPYHVLTFETANKVSEEGFVKPLISYLNDSNYFNQLKEAYRNNLAIKMKANDSIIGQIDSFLNTFKNSTASNSKSSSLVYYNENTQLNEIIKTKELLFAEQGSLRIDFINSDQIIKEIVVSTNLKNIKSINGKLKLVLPVLFVFFYLFIYFFMVFYRNESSKLK
ncbi:hypothetical protein [Flavobacterium aurantiibacter]|uniref:Uncharacterized protein n=1 Tax=Flavobacterium aurantiibacter TaxID=2023067 RepID=A0A255ZJ19_9FLAO|nr:hypothetical protein [Flavobacterium aurantiibacter]OYQ41547.1 hypothetical protein CHX27_12815 [Flavobacterium aurantiibacter]